MVLGSLSGSNRAGWLSIGDLQYLCSSYNTIVKQRLLKLCQDLIVESVLVQSGSIYVYIYLSVFNIVILF